MDPDPISDISHLGIVGENLWRKPVFFRFLENLPTKEFAYSLSSRFGKNLPQLTDLSSENASATCVNIFGLT